MTVILISLTLRNSRSLMSDAGFQIPECRPQNCHFTFHLSHFAHHPPDQPLIMGCTSNTRCMCMYLFSSFGPSESVHVRMTSAQATQLQLLAFTYVAILDLHK